MPGATASQVNFGVPCSGDDLRLMETHLSDIWLAMLAALDMQIHKVVAPSLDASFPANLRKMASPPGCLPARARGPDKVPPKAQGTNKICH